MYPPTPTSMDAGYDSSSDDEYLWTAASRLPHRGGKPSPTCKQPRSPQSHSHSHQLQHQHLSLLRPSRSRSAPPPSTHAKSARHPALAPLQGVMLAAPSVDVSFDDDDWMPPPSSSPRLYRAASVGNSWGVTSIGRGFRWDRQGEDSSSDHDKDDESSQDAIDASKDRTATLRPTRPAWLSTSAVPRSAANNSMNGNNMLSTSITPPTPLSPLSSPRSGSFIAGPLTRSPVQSRPSSPRPFASRPASPRPTSPLAPGASSVRSPLSSTPSSPRSSQFPRMRRRSSQQRVSLIAGRVSIAPIEPPSPLPAGPQRLVRTNSAASYLSVASSTGPPTPNEKSQTVGERSISEFVIEREIGRGAYGLVKRAREMMDDGSLGPPIIIKQIIKSRILADCWKRHPKFGTIPIEIYVMSAISSTHYVLPPPRPWDPLRNKPDVPNEWVEGKVVSGHPNICPLLDFFEDNHYYYLVLPSTTPEPVPNEPPPPTDLFDLVESYPNGLPPDMIRTYLGQIADAVAFLHSKGIVHRDIKDENVVLGTNGKCVLIDFGSSGLVKKSGWDTFSGTLDYAGPEILRGERYYGKEQDVWAFGVVAYVMLVGECPFTTAAEAQEGLESPFSNASIALDERCMEGKEKEGEESDGGGALGDAAALVRACLRVDVNARPSFQRILQSRFLSGNGGWGLNS
ncbi:kinase-like protein [Trametes coccinea BRFM310]|uniref:Kinase-like protein n=1 Tax=Trametes coccinea (strain BRFM310) TaxID=1353009 RepID=A0A1Y2IQS3_TRAC3|nr:kinase-like protein [Trametes coccinea BRFM310]